MGLNYQHTYLKNSSHHMSVAPMKYEIWYDMGWIEIGLMDENEMRFWVWKWIGWNGEPMVCSYPLATALSTFLSLLFLWDCLWLWWELDGRFGDWTWDGYDNQK